jgi:hypothetical protein
MDTSALHEEITEQLLRKVEESKFFHLPAMNRIERRIRTRDELERYIEVLVAKLEQTGFRSETVLDRIDGLVQQLERLDRKRAD